MYLKSLVLKGFKSFADRSVLSLEPGITAIVGPNGSGKSNILDAVLWVLGERNARNLRGQAMEDVIFAGSSTRKQVGIVEVDLVLDNGDGTLPVDFDEVCITRRMYRSGESEYLINGTLCRRMDVIDILHDSGLGTGTHSIISQGHLDSILQSKPEDCRALIEEAAGVLKHKQRKEKSERKLAQMDQHLLRIQDITAEVERQIKPLERKAKRALMYRDLADELAGLTLGLAVDDLRTLQGHWEAACASERELQSALSLATEHAEKADAQAQELQSQLQSQTEDAGALAESFHRTSSAAEHIDATAMLLRERKRSAVRSREERRGRLESDRERLCEATGEEAQARETLSAVSAEKAVADAALAKATAERDEASASLQALQREAAGLEECERNGARLCEDLRAEKAAASEALSTSVADGKLLAAKQTDAAERLKTAEGRLADLEARLQESEKAVQQAQAADEAARAAAAAAFTEVETIRSALEETRVAKAKLEAQVAGLEEGEKNRARLNDLLSWMLERSDELGLQGTLIDAIDVPEGLGPALEMLLGDAVNAALAADAETARVALGALAASEETGSVMLLTPAATPEAGTLPAGIDGVFLIDLLEYSPEREAIVHALLGDVILCDTKEGALAADAALNAAGAAQSPWRIASKDGCVITSDGVRSFSRREEGDVGELERHRLLGETREKARAADAGLASAQQRLEAASEKMRGAQKEGMDRTSALAGTRGAHESLADQVASLRTSLEHDRATYADIERRANDNATMLASMKPDGERIDADLQRAADNLTQAKESLAQLRGRIAPLRERVSALNDAHSEARLAVGTLQEREAYAKRMLESRSVAIAALDAQIAAATAVSMRSGAADAVDGIIVSLEQLRSALTRRISQLEQGMDAARENSTGIHARIDAARKQAVEAHAAVDERTQHMADLRVEKGRLEVQVEAAIAVIEGEGISLETALKQPEPENRPESEERADKLRRRIANMGTINPDAAAEYEELKHRYDYLREQVDDMLAARRALSKIIDVIDGRMRTDFIDTFHKVDENFQDIFAELFPGGSASLSLVDEGDLEHSGVEVNAQPRGKRITKMSLMSGGEKSLTALALLFAVYKTRSTPFYILDEVEAALDDTNLRRLCAYLNAMRDRAQLIMITHQRRTMEMSDVLYGISMQSDGVTKLVSQKLDRDRRSEEGRQ